MKPATHAVITATFVIVYVAAVVTAGVLYAKAFVYVDGGLFINGLIASATGGIVLCWAYKWHDGVQPSIIIHYPIAILASIFYPCVFGAVAWVIYHIVKFVF